MRRLLTGGIKAIVAIAALSTAAHWAMRVQRAPTAMPAPLAAAKDPVSTGSILTRSAESPTRERLADVTRGLDQKHLGELFSGATGDKPKVEKAAARH
ncbi:hypothetical protein [Methylobacterium sp. Leaf93]|uniref:hypothetical protein n=1 Tax=Methylobacterium sp. Leaf93 TaxID=1736249 RepID=UPI0006FA311E|nr:hypothetical protein [Methylobacterium sp. Leaf93]KQP03284.1 hypothetical protein ASF26_13305 [Methylobacterium sp. Leaf93]